MVRSTEVRHRSVGPGTRAGGLWGSVRLGRGCGAAGAQHRAVPDATTPEGRGCSGPLAPMRFILSTCLSLWHCQLYPPAGIWCFTELLVLGEWPRSLDKCAEGMHLDTAAGQGPALVYGMKYNLSPKPGLIEEGILFGSPGR